MALFLILFYMFKDFIVNIICYFRGSECGAKVNINSSSITSPCFLRQGLSLNLEFTNLTRLAGREAPGILLSLLSSMEIMGTRCHVVF